MDLIVFACKMQSRWCVLLVTSLSWCLHISIADTVVGVEEEWGEGLKVLSTYLPDSCEHRTRSGDVVHYHYVGRLDDGKEFGKSFDYNTPYIVALGEGRIIAGMDRGLMDMCLWERRRITIPPHLGYGSSGVGAIIPPHATLVFYVRLIKIERAGLQLQKEASLDELWLKSMDAYRDKDWQTVVDNLEEALRLFNTYENSTLLCLQQCNENASPQLLEKDLETIADYSGNDPIIKQFIIYASRAKCIRECKAKELRATLRYPDPDILNRFKRRETYSFLHFSYYQLDNYEEAGKCFFTFMFYNPKSEQVTTNTPFYRKKLELEPDEFVWREPPTQPHQDHFLEGLNAYENEHYLEAVDLIESALPMYRQALNNCLLMCEDILVVNITDRDMSQGMREIMDHYVYSLSVDMLEYHSVLATAVREVLECRVRCHDDMARVKGEVLEDYLPHHFHYLQFSYYKLGQLVKAAETAATYIGMIPSDEVMRNNMRYYTSNYKLQPDDFMPREEYVEITEKLETEKRLLHFSTHKAPKKKQGRRGDAEQLHHQEL